MKSISYQPERDENGRHDTWLEVVRRQVSSLNFGLVQIVVHEGRVVQVDRTEKVRFAHPIAVAAEQD